MKSSKVLKILNISRQTLVKYVKNGDIRVVMQTNILSKVVGDSDFIGQITGSGRMLRPIRCSSPFRVA